MKLNALALITVAVAVLAAPATSATAAPSCDPTTSDGYLACMGGGIPWQNQYGSSPDTYGSLGQRGFLAENRKMGIGPSIGSDADLLKLGYRICDWRAHGLSESFIQAKLQEGGHLDPVTTEVLAVNAGFLCNPDGTPWN